MRIPVRRLAAVAAMAMLLVLTAAIAGPAATLHVAADVSGAPFEFYPSGSHVARGFDVDLLAAMSAKLGGTPVMVNHRFDDLLAAVRRGQFDLAMSAISDTGQREKLVDFVDYFVAGGGIMVPAGNPQRVFSIAGLCGYAATVESGTSYEADLDKQSTACQAVGLGPIKILTFPTDDAAFSAFIEGKSQAYIADYPVQEYRARVANAGHALEIVGRQFDVVPYGIAVSKQNAALRSAVQRALLAIVADGTYDELLKKWGLTRGGLRFAPVNVGKLFEK
jgi:polar amino acid transport system substrate-binding protein